ncbi:MAG: urease accessory protein UreE [Deltaproteobacteria bacterium]|nr:urease accessory protein UreE [Deltaproteobacteria bacterium]
MNRATSIKPAGEWPREKAIDSVTLTHENRRRRRVRLITDGGQEFLLDLPHVATLKDGDGLALDSGEWITIRADNESLAEITCPNLHRLLRIAWHLGNRHVPTVVAEDRLLIRNDGIILHMVSQLGGMVRFVELPFYPEGGAYEDAAAGSELPSDQKNKSEPHLHNSTHHG